MVLSCCSSLVGFWCVSGFLGQRGALLFRKVYRPAACNMFCKIVNNIIFQLSFCCYSEKNIYFIPKAVIMKHITYSLFKPKFARFEKMPLYMGLCFDITFTYTCHQSYLWYDFNPNCSFCLYLWESLEQKPREYVNWIWQDKVLSIKNIFRNEIIFWGENIDKPSVMYKTMNKEKKWIEKSSSP